MNNPTELSVQVKFVSIDDNYKFPDYPISLSNSLNVQNLNEIVNQILKLEIPISFSFLIQKKLIKNTLETFISEHALSKETLITIEFYESPPFPQNNSTIKTNDWISSLCGFNEELCIVGSYDQTIQVLNKKDASIRFSSHLHSGTVKGIDLINHQSNPQLVTCSQDETIILSKVQLDEEKLNLLRVFKGHSSSIECVSVLQNTSKFISSSWDQSIKLWDSTKISKPSELSSFDCLETYVGHLDVVTCCLWKNDRNIYSAGWDHAIRVWDVESKINLETIVLPNAIHQICTSSLNSPLIITANSDSLIRLIDTRIQSVSCVFNDHFGMISSVDWSSTNENYFLSGSYDQTIKTWDLRSNVPLHTMKDHSDNVLCVKWTNNYLVSASSDKTVRFYSNN